MAARPEGVETRQVSADSEAAPSTTTAPEPAAPATGGPGALPAPTAVAGPKAPTAPKPTTAPTGAAVPDRSRPAGMTYEPQAVWPETLAELDRLQAAVDRGHQPWRNDPAEVARAYLLERGLPAPGLAAFRAGASDIGQVEYTSGGAGGTVQLQRLLKGSIWYVTGSRTAHLPGVGVTRREGEPGGGGPGRCRGRRADGQGQAPRRRLGGGPHPPGARRRSRLDHPRSGLRGARRPAPFRRRWRADRVRRPLPRRRNGWRQVQRPRRRVPPERRRPGPGADRHDAGRGPDRIRPAAGHHRGPLLPGLPVRQPAHGRGPGRRRGLDHGRLHHRVGADHRHRVRHLGGELRGRGAPGVRGTGSGDRSRTGGAGWSSGRATPLWLGTP